MYSTLMESDGVDPSGRGEGTTRTGRTREVRTRSVSLPSSQMLGHKTTQRTTRFYRKHDRSCC